MTIKYQSDVPGSSTARPTFVLAPLAKRIGTRVLMGVSLSLLAGSMAFAQQESDTESNNNEVVEDIVVSGHRFSLRSAIDRKKNAGTMTDSLVAEDIGEFPDKNVGEALQRITGVQLARDFGEGAQVSIRGVDPDLLRVEVNNVSVMGRGGSRAVDFRDLASELVKSLDVIKGSEARLTEGGIGGTIQINTRKPNEFQDHYFSASGELQYNDLSEATDPRINLTGVWKFSDDFGALINITASEKQTMIHALRNTEWHRVADYDNSPDKTVVDEDYASVTNVADCDGVQACEMQWWDFSPRLPRYGIWGREEKRISANTMFQYNINDDLSVHVGYTYNERDAEATDLNLHLETHSAARVNPDSVLVDENHNVTYFESQAATVTNRTLNFNWLRKTSVFDTGFEFNRGAWDISGIVAYSTSDQDIDSRDTHVTANGIAGVQVTLDDRGAPEWDFNTGYHINQEDPTDTSDTFDVNSPASYRSRSRFKYEPMVDKTTESNVKLDAVYNFDEGFITKLRSGFQVTSNSTENSRREHNIIRDVGQIYNGIEWTEDDQIALITGNTFTSPRLFSGYDLGVDTIGRYEAINTEPFIAAIRAISGDNTTRSDLDVRVGNFDISVDTQAVYLQSDFATQLGGMPFWGNLGARYVVTQTDTNGDVTERVIVDQVDEDGNVLVDPNTGQDLAGVEDPDHPGAFVGRKTVSREYSDFLPSINMNLELIPDELVLYFGAAKVMARPRAGDLNVNATCTIHTTRQSQIDGRANECSGGNPLLNPYRATQMDLALNWYPNDDSIVSGALFSKDITSWILDAETRQNIDFFADGRLWDVRQKVNGSGVTVEGFELQASTVFTMLPHPFSGLGGSVNYTHLEAKDVGLFNQLTGEELPFPSQSKHSYNVTGFWEGESVSVRLAYNYRDEFLARPSDRSGNPVFIEDAGYLDAKVSYRVPNTNLRFFIDARNLTKEARVETAGKRRLSDLQYSGREFALGVSYRM